VSDLRVQAEAWLKAKLAMPERLLGRRDAAREKERNMKPPSLSDWLQQGP
jgi:hypothetical protein